MGSLKLQGTRKEVPGRVMARIGITAGVGAPLLEAGGATGLGPGGPLMALVEDSGLALGRVLGPGLEAGMVMGRVVLLVVVVALAEEVVATIDLTFKVKNSYI